MVHVLRRRGDDGVVALLVAVFAVVAFILGALVVERGAAYEARRDAQNAADVAAVAAAAIFYDAAGAAHKQQAGQAAETYARKNFPGDQPAGDYWDGCVAPPVTGGWEAWQPPTGPPVPCVAFLDSGPRYTRVRVVVPGLDTPELFGAVSGDVRALAEARIPGFISNASFPCELCVVGNFNAGGNSDVSVQGRARVGGPDPPYENLVATGGVTRGPIALDPAPGQPTGLVDRDEADRACQEGVYASISACTSFGPGRYVITGGGNAFNASAVNAVFYFTCGSGAAPTPCAVGQPGAGILGSSGITIIGGATRGTYQGYAIIFDPNNASAIDMSGNGTLTINGAVHAPSAGVTGEGNGEVEINGLLGVGGVDIGGYRRLRIQGAAIAFPLVETGTLGLVK